MKRIEAKTLDAAYAKAKEFFECSIIDLKIEVIQQHSNGFLGFFKKPAIIIVVLDKKVEENAEKKKSENSVKKIVTEKVAPKVTDKRTEPLMEKTQKIHKKQNSHCEIEEVRKNQVHVDNTIMPTSFVTGQDEVAETANDFTETLSVKESQNSTENIESTLYEEELQAEDAVDEIQEKINTLFTGICFDIDKIEVSVYDEKTILITFNGKDAALLIGKEGYRYKALSYMLFNWITSKYNLQLRLEVAEFLKNQEDAINRYLSGVCESIDRDGRAQTKILDGVLVQIALTELRNKYPNKYVAVRTTRDGNKFIIINEYNNY